MTSKSLSALLDQYREQKDLLPLLEEVQRMYGYLPLEFIPEIANRLGITTSEVYGVSTFYSFLSRKPQGRNVIRVCKSLPCWLKKHESVIIELEKQLDIKPGQTTPDGKFSLELTNCIGACDHAPAMMVNDVTYGELTVEKLSEILELYQ
ncbi:NADH-quinone oxidoreductase subunit NuoE [Chloroflexota bacterium]